jgi:hypothetical protein
MLALEKFSSSRPEKTYSVHHAVPFLKKGHETKKQTFEEVCMHKAGSTGAALLNLAGWHNLVGSIIHATA